jgi:plastocyanin
MSRRILGALTLVASLSLVGAACSSKSTPSTTPGTSTPAATGAQVQATAQLTFTPVGTTITAGQTVTWMNSSGVAHTVTFDSGPAFNEPLADGSQVARMFATKGTFAYHCTIHGQSMHGTVVVN